MSKDISGKYTLIKRGDKSVRGDLPTESQVQKALRTRNILWTILGLAIAAGLFVMFLMVPQIFFTTLKIVGILAGIGAALYGISVGVDAAFDSAETLRKAQSYGVLEDE